MVNDKIPGLDISVADLGAWCSGHIDGFVGLRGVRKYGTGQSNPTYRLDAASGIYVLRAKPPGALLPKAHDVAREYRVMAALGRSAVPVPRMLALAEDVSSPIGRAFFVMEHVDGRILWDPALPEIPKADRAAHVDAMNRVLAALHDTDVASVGLADFGRPHDYFARQVTLWSRQYTASARAPLPQMTRLMDWLPDAAPGDDGQATLVHGDFRLDNMIFHPVEPRVVALLDWELSTLGHPVADLAYQCMQWRLPHDAIALRGLGGLDRAGLGLPDESAYTAAYCARRGLPALPHWRLWLVLAFFRLAAILEGVVERARQGNASNPDAARAYAATIPVLAEMACDIADDV